MGKGLRLMGIKVVRKPNGKRYVYRRVNGNLVPLPDLPENHPDFLEAYVAAGKAKPKRRAADGTLSLLIAKFLVSREFKLRKHSTQVVWRRRLDKMDADFGGAPVEKLTTEHIRKALRKLAPGAARSERTVWRALFAYAVEEGWRADNPAKTVTVPTYTAKPHETWSEEDVQRFRDHWPVGSGERQAMEVIYWTAARCVDAVWLGSQLVRDGVLEFEQTKTEGLAVVPITVPVDDFLSEDQTHFLSVISGDMIWILTRSGKPRKVKSLSQLVSRAARDAGLVGKTAHGLRKARATKLAQHGWTPHRIAAWTGHESLGEVTHYTRAVDRRGLVARTEADSNMGNRVEKFPTTSKYGRNGNDL